MRSPSTNGSVSSQSQDLLVLADDEREQRRLDGVGLAAEPAIAVLAAVQVVRREGDEAALGQAGGEVVVGGGVGVDRVPRQAVAAVLARRRPAAARPAAGPWARPARPRRTRRARRRAPRHTPSISSVSSDLTRPRVGRQERLRRSAHGLRVEPFAKRPSAVGELPAGSVGRAASVLQRDARPAPASLVQKKPVAHVLRRAHERLNVRSNCCTVRSCRSPDRSAPRRSTGISAPRRHPASGCSPDAARTRRAPPWTEAPRAGRRDRCTSDGVGKPPRQGCGRTRR